MSFRFGSRLAGTAQCILRARAPLRSTAFKEVSLNSSPLVQSSRMTPSLSAVNFAHLTVPKASMMQMNIHTIGNLALDITSLSEEDTLYDNIIELLLILEKRKKTECA